MGERIMLAGGTSGALGFAEHRYPDRAEILGIPISLASAGVVGTMLVMGTGGRKSRPFLEGVATGAICAYGYRFGAEMGAKSLEDSKKAA